MTTADHGPDSEFDPQEPDVTVGSGGEWPSAAPDDGVADADAGVADAGAAAAGPSAALPPPPAPPVGAVEHQPLPDGAVYVDTSAQNWGLLAHISGFIAATVVLAFLGPLLVWLVKRDEHPFIAYHAAEAFNFQLSVFLYGTLLVLVALTVIGLPVAIIGGIILGVAWIVLPILAALKASQGESFTYPMTIGFLRP